MKIPSVELLAALQQSRNTAEREGFPGVVAQVQRYIDDVEAMPAGYLVVEPEFTPQERFIHQVKVGVGEPDVTQVELNEALLHFMGEPISDRLTAAMTAWIIGNRATKWRKAL